MTTPSPSGSVNPAVYIVSPDVGREGRALLVVDPAHFEGESTDQVLRPTPLGHRARLQRAGLGAYGEIWLLPEPDRVKRPLEDYVQLVEVLG